MNRQVSIIIGRFQPFHVGHAALIKYAMSRPPNGSDLTIVVIGSAASAPTIKNPWNVRDRAAMLASLFEENISGRVVWENVMDHPYDDNAWLREVKIRLSKHLRPDDEVTLMGHDKDESTYYLKLFPEWKFLDVGQKRGGIDATTIRKQIFENGVVPDELPDGVQNYLRKNWMGHEEHIRLTQEYKYITSEEERLAKQKYQAPILAVDPVVFAPGKVLTIKRKNTEYGYNLRSLPGTIVRRGETLMQAVLRSLDEKADLRPSPEMSRFNRCFDKPNRSLSGHRITVAFRFDIPEPWSTVTGEWIDIAHIDLYAEEFFEDHASIIEEMLKH